MKKKSSIFRRTLFSIMIPEVFFYFIIAIFGLTQVAELVVQIKVERKAYAEKEIDNVLEFQDVSLGYIESALDQRIKAIYSELNRFQNLNDREIETMDLHRLSNQLKMDPVLENIYIINQDGIIVNTTDSTDLGLSLFGFGLAYKQFLQKVFATDSIYFDDLIIPVHTETVKKYMYQSTKNRHYLIEVGVNSNDAQNIIERVKNKINEIADSNSHVLSLDIVYQRDRLASFNDPARTFSESESQRIRSLLDSDTIVPQADSGSTIHFSLSTAENHKMVQAAHNSNITYKPFVRPDSDLFKKGVLIMQIDDSWIASLLESQLKADFFFLVAIVLVMLLVVFFNTRRITKPIINLTKKARLIEEGQLNERATIKRHDELGVLAHQFNNMVQRLQDNQEEIEQKHKEITASINYAKRIQKAILPPDWLIQKHLLDYFVLYLPKDVVAGDFYWLEHLDEKLLFAAADCTGHGVPGAMVSVVCNNALNRAVREFGLTQPSFILDKTRELVVREFGKSDDDVKDGMDIALCSLDRSNRVLQYAGAHNPLWVVRNGTLLVTKADKQPIGNFEHPKPYTNHSIALEKGDVIYIFSDGYADQFGGPKDRKFGYKQLRELMLKISVLPMDQQIQTLKSTLNDWMEQSMDGQIDDICIIGVKI